MPHLLRKSNKYINRLRKARVHHKLIFSLIGAFGIIFVWKGVWSLLDAQPFIGHSIEIILMGLLLAAISGALFKMI